jgi:hypothetical protein
VDWEPGDVIEETLKVEGEGSSCIPLLGSVGNLEGSVKGSEVRVEGDRVEEAGEKAFRGAAGGERWRSTSEGGTGGRLFECCELEREPSNP